MSLFDKPSTHAWFPQSKASPFGQALRPLVRPTDSGRIFVRNEITKAFGLPGVARLAFGRRLRDRITLPYYPELGAAALRPLRRGST